MFLTCVCLCVASPSPVVSVRTCQGPPCCRAGQGRLSPGAPALQPKQQWTAAATCCSDSSVQWVTAVCSLRGAARYLTTARCPPGPCPLPALLHGELAAGRALSRAGVSRMGLSRMGLSLGQGSPGPLQPPLSGAAFRLGAGAGGWRLHQGRGERFCRLRAQLRAPQSWFMQIL